MAQDKRPCKLTDLFGMPIMTRETGRKLGNVKDIIFDPEAGKLEALTIETNGFFGPKRWLVLAPDIRSIGDDAIMVDNGRVLRNPFYARREADILDQNNTLTSKTVVTVSGNILGTVTDVFIDLDTGKALRYEVSGGAAADVSSGRRVFPVPDALVVGPDALVVPDSVEIQMQAQEPGGLAGAYKGTREQAQGFWDRVKDWWADVTKSADEKEAEYALGKIAGADVVDDQGNIIVREGEEITEREVVRARVSGKMHQLALAAGWGVTRRGYERAAGRISEAAQEQEAKFVLGKKADRTVRDDQGNVIVWKDEEIDQEVIDRAREAGKLGALTSAVTVAGAKGAFGRIGEATRGAYESARGGVTGASEEYGRRRLTSQQREMAIGKVSATDIRDADGNLIIAEGEIFTPMILQRLEDEGRIDQIRLMPVMGPDRTPAEYQVPRIELVVRAEDTHHTD